MKQKYSSAYYLAYTCECMVTWSHHVRVRDFL